MYLDPYPNSSSHRISNDFADLPTNELNCLCVIILLLILIASILLAHTAPSGPSVHYYVTQMDHPGLPGLAFLKFGSPQNF